MTSRFIVDRALPERTKLTFYFPMPTTGDSYYVIELPFFENVTIKESKKANYQKYSLISRSSNLYSYLGADSRMLTLNFNLSLPHILEEHPEINLDKYISYMQDKDNVELEKQKFLEPYKAQSLPNSMAFKLGTEYTKSLARDSAKQVLNDLGTLNVLDRETIRSRYGLNSLELDQISQNAESVTTEIPNVDFDQQQVEYSESQQLKYKIIDLIVYWTNIIRSSVVNYTNNPIYGPPIIRLSHGVMYQDIPCICSNYSIDYNETMGYDADTLLPRQISISLKLEELRTGDFGEFAPKGNPLQRDNLAGWEAVVLGETNSMDPGY